jgi:bifunctional UDP-N-acetylglucosamine pyrophosphorylase/glucosamine-1-phosphate N-acetyltransferase
MQAVILAAGKGTRLLPLTEKTPKPLIPLKGKPILFYILESLPEEISEVIIVTGYLKEEIEKTIGNSFGGKKIIYTPQGDIKGTYGALLAAKPFLKSPFLVLGADDISSKSDIQSLIKQPLAFGYTVKKLPAKEYLILDIQNNYVKGFRRAKEEELEEVHPMGSGYYVLNSSFWDYTPESFGEGEKREYGIPQTLRKMLLEENFSAVLMNNWIQINSLEDLHNAETKIK